MQTTAGYYLKIGANVLSRNVIKENVVEVVHLNTENDNLEAYYKTLNVRLIDHIVLNDGTEFIVDDEGLLKSENPVFEVHTGDSDTPFHIAGTFLIGRCIEIDGELKFAGYENKNDLFEAAVKNEILVNLMGITK